MRLTVVAAVAFVAQLLIFIVVPRALGVFGSAQPTEIVWPLLAMAASIALAWWVLRAHGLRNWDERFIGWAFALGMGTSIVLIALLAVVGMLATSFGFESAFGATVPVIGLIACSSVLFVVIASAVVRKGLRDHGDSIGARDFLE